jgi:DNA-binding transcriptional MocR family regulator
MSEFLYTKIVSRIEHQIRTGLLVAGDKLPSVRALSLEQGISISTAFKAYVELENMGMIEARPKSGYYIKFSIRKFDRAPEAILPVKNKPADITQMIAMIYRSLSNTNILLLSRAAPPANLIPVAKLNKSMLESLRKSPSGNSGYESLQGNVSLRKQIAKNAFAWGGNLTENDVLTTQGCMEALAFSLQAVTKSGDTVAIESPTYFGIFNLLLGLNLKVLEIPVDQETGINIKYLEKAMDKTVIKACLFVTNFGNPVGNAMPDQRKKKLVKLLTARKIPLIEDDIYGEIYFGKGRPKTCKSFDTKGWVILCSSVSKTIAPGYRVGWCIPGRFKEQILDIKMRHTISSATPTQAAIGHFFETGRYDLHMRKLRRELYLQSVRYKQAIINYFPADVKISSPQGGYALWIELNKNIDALELYKAAIKQNISIAPGQIFSTDARFTNFIRISYGLTFTDQLEKGFKVLGDLIKSMSPKKKHPTKKKKPS